MMRRPSIEPLDRSSECRYAVQHLARRLSSLRIWRTVATTWNVFWQNLSSLSRPSRRRQRKPPTANTDRPQAGAATAPSALPTEESEQAIVSHFGARNRFPTAVMCARTPTSGLQQKARPLNSECFGGYHSLKSSETSPLSFDSAIETGRRTASQLFRGWEAEGSLKLERKERIDSPDGGPATSAWPPASQWKQPTPKGNWLEKPVSS